MLALLLEEHQDAGVAHAVGDYLDLLCKEFRCLGWREEWWGWVFGFDPFEDEGGFIDWFAVGGDQDW